MYNININQTVIEYSRVLVKNMLTMMIMFIMMTMMNMMTVMTMMIMMTMFNTNVRLYSSALVEHIVRLGGRKSPMDCHPTEQRTVCLVFLYIFYIHCMYYNFIV